MNLWNLFCSIFHFSSARTAVVPNKTELQPTHHVVVQPQPDLQPAHHVVNQPQPEIKKGGNLSNRPSVHCSNDDDYDSDYYGTDGDGGRSSTSAKLMRYHCRKKAEERLQAVEAFSSSNVTEASSSKTAFIGWDSYIYKHQAMSYGNDGYNVWRRMQRGGRASRNAFLAELYPHRYKASLE